VSDGSSSKARKVLRALRRIGWSVKRTVGGSHMTLQRPGWKDYTWAWHDSTELGPVALRKIGRDTGLRPDDL
jgi:predicted RNA binding protein YcfA (HicA-like mRNA interferase family)